MSGHSDDTKEMLTLLEQADIMLGCVSRIELPDYRQRDELCRRIHDVLVANRWREP